MVISMDYEDIYGTNMIKLWNFCFEHCNRITLTNSSNPKYTVEEYNKAIEYQQLDFNWEDIEDYYSNLSQEDKEQLDNNMQSYKLQNMRNYFMGIYSREELDELLSNLRKIVELSEREVAFQNHCTTSSAIMENYTFRINDNLKPYFYKMDNIFSSIEIMDNIRMDDPVFYMDNKRFFSICSHEQYATLDVSEEEYEEFSKLNIPHIDSNKMWWHEEYNEKYMKYDKYPSILGQRGLICGLKGYEEIIELELGNHEENEQIYNDFKGKLLPNLITFDKILEAISNRYTLIPMQSDELRERTKQNILWNTCLARHLPESREMRIVIFLVVENEKSAHLYDKQKEEFKFYTEKVNTYRENYSTEEFKKIPIIVGWEYNTNYLWVEGSFKLRDEITLIRGLSETELRNRELLVSYVKAIKKSDLL